MRDVCPACAGVLVDDGRGAQVCKRCGGAWAAERGLARALFEVLAPSTESTSRKCPQCALPLTSWSVTAMAGAFVERCVPCGGVYLDRTDRALVQRLVQRSALEGAIRTMTTSERAELASGLVERDPLAPVSITPAQQGLAILGVPSLAHSRGERLPLFTLALVLVVVLTPLSPVFGVLEAGGWFAAIEHALLVFAFLGGVERASRSAALVVVIAGLSLALGVRALWGVPVLGGVDGVVAASIGACALVQSRAHVVLGLLRAVAVPIPVAAVIIGVLGGVIDLVTDDVHTLAVHAVALVGGGVIGWLTQRRAVA
jgi:Zn-finger nucleic acid-binding protein